MLSPRRVSPNLRIASSGIQGLYLSTGGRQIEALPEAARGKVRAKLLSFPMTPDRPGARRLRPPPISIAFASATTGRHIAYSEDWLLIAGTEG